MRESWAGRNRGQVQLAQPFGQRWDLDPHSLTQPFLPFQQLWSRWKLTGRGLHVQHDQRPPIFYCITRFYSTVGFHNAPINYCAETHHWAPPSSTQRALEWNSLTGRACGGLSSQLVPEAKRLAALAEGEETYGSTYLGSPQSRWKGNAELSNNQDAPKISLTYLFSIEKPLFLLFFLDLEQIESSPVL